MIDGKITKNNKTLHIIMECLLCHEKNHTTLFCPSDRAKTIENTLNRCILVNLLRLYHSYNESVEWLAISQHFTRLSFGELLYLNRNWMLEENPYWGRESYIYFYISKQTEILYSNSRLYHEHVFSSRIREYMWIDVNYWKNMAYAHGSGFSREDTDHMIENINRLRVETMEQANLLYDEDEDDIEEDPQTQTNNIQYIQTAQQETILHDCAICLHEGLIYEECQQLQCGHIFCKQCTDKCIEKNPTCALCREPITSVKIFYTG